MRGATVSLLTLVAPYYYLIFFRMLMKFALQ